MRKMLIVENNTFLRELLVKYFEEDARYGVVTSTSNASHAAELCKTMQMDMVLLGICTEDGNYGGIKGAADIKKEQPDVKVVLMTSLPELSYITEAKKAGVDSFIYQTDTLDHLHHLIDQTMEGESVWPDTEGIPSRAPTFELTKRETEVARLICCECLSRNDIAKRLGISPNTVKTLTDRIVSKVGVNSIRELLRFMLSNNYFLPDE